MARRLEVRKETVLNWEHGKATPGASQVPKIVDFLGYDPFPVPETPGEEIKALRRRLGVSQRAAANALSVDPSTLSRWEADEGAPPVHAMELIRAFRRGT